MISFSRSPVRPQKVFDDEAHKRPIHIFFRQLDFSSEPGFANEILENEPRSCLTDA